MDKDVVFKKLEQVLALLRELEPLLNRSFADFTKDTLVVRGAERDFQLIVDIAIDINSQMIIGKGGKAPDTYRQSFLELGRLGVLSAALAQELAPTASLRNILIHEYDFEADYEKFFSAAKKSVPLYEAYCRAVYAFLQ